MSENQVLYLKMRKRYKYQIVLLRIIIGALFFIIWEIAARTKLIDSFFFSSPSRIVSTMIIYSKNGSLFYHIGCTLLETFVSFFLVTVISILIAIWLWYFKKASDVSEPFWVILNSLPKSALAPLFIVWLGTGMKTIIVAGISVAVFGSIINIYTGFHQVSESRIKLIYTLNGTKKDVLTKVILPENIPNILSNMKVNIGLSLVGVIIGEFLAARRGLGYLIIYGSQVFKLDLVLMSIVILCFIAVILYCIIHFIEKRFKKT